MNMYMYTCMKDLKTAVHILLQCSGVANYKAKYHGSAGLQQTQEQAKIPGGAMVDPSRTLDPPFAK